MTLPGKRALSFAPEAVRGLIRGADPFDPDRDRVAFCRFLTDRSCQPAARCVTRGRLKPPDREHDC